MARRPGESRELGLGRLAPGIRAEVMPTGGEPPGQIARSRPRVRSEGNRAVRGSAGVDRPTRTRSQSGVR